jgi:long-chain acyl-CoA synthetase
LNTNKGKILRELSRFKAGLLGDTILRNSFLYADREAFIYGNKRVTFKQYNERVNSLIAALNDRGIRKGDAIGVVSFNCIEYSEVFGAAGKGGFIMAPLNARSSAKELEYLIQDCGTRVLFVDPDMVDIINSLRPNIPDVKHFISFEKTIPNMEYHDNLIAKYAPSEPDVELDDDTPALLLYTSGTTGVPKGALYTQGQLREDILGHCIDIPARQEDKGLLIMPYFHIGGTIWHYTFFQRAACNVIMKNFDPRITLQIIEQEKISCVCVVPTHIAAILAVPELKNFNTKSLRLVKYVGSPMPVQILKQAIAQWGLIFCQAYGQTETGPDITILEEIDHDVINKSPKEQERLLSCGRPGTNIQVRIVDDNEHDVDTGEIGEIIVKSRHIMREYWKKPKETQTTIINGWLHTRDMGRYDEEGYIYIVDRKNDMIISGGENIYPREVEETLYQHPSVLECAVFGIPDPKWVESVHAVVALKQGKAVTSQELIDFCKQNIARYKAPKSVEIVDSLPKGGSGKILKKELRKKYWQ